MKGAGLATILFGVVVSAVTLGVNANMAVPTDLRGKSDEAGFRVMQTLFGCCCVGFTLLPGLVITLVAFNLNTGEPGGGGRGYDDEEEFEDDRPRRRRNGYE